MVHEMPQDQSGSPHAPTGTGAGQPEVPRRRARKAIRRATGTVIILGALFLAVILTAIVRHGGNPASPATARTVATFSGSGDQNTPRFTVGTTWKLSYSFDCSSFGQAGNFQVEVDGGNDPALTVNDLGDGESGSTLAYDDAGTHYLQIVSQCAWNVKVIDES